MVSTDLIGSEDHKKKCGDGTHNGGWQLFVATNRRRTNFID
jgi:hypothetical protein